MLPVIFNDEACPAGQGVHAVAPPLEDVPIGHKVQAVEALPAVYEPAGQSLHVPAASKAAYLPGTQGVQPLKDPLDMCPARQLSHLDASVPSWK